jgi:hypothetical protein
MRRLRSCVAFGVCGLLAACSAGGTSGDAGAGNEAGLESGNGDDGSMCGQTLCVHGDQPSQCPSCSPSSGDICSPPAAVTCNYSNGCSGALENVSQCTCVLPDAGSDDAGDAGDAGSSGGNAHWSCTLGV